MKEIKVGDVYFENEIVKVTYINGHYHGHFMYEIDFLGHISKYSCSEEYIDKTIKKRIDAYNLIPSGCKIIPKHLIEMFNGLLVGGVLEDSIKIVYGVCSNKIQGFSCSIFFVPSKEYLESIMDYDSFHGDLIIKKKNS